MKEAGFINSFVGKSYIIYIMERLCDFLSDFLDSSGLANFFTILLSKVVLVRIILPSNTGDSKAAISALHTIWNTGLIIEKKSKVEKRKARKAKVIAKKRMKFLHLVSRTSRNFGLSSDKKEDRKTGPKGGIPFLEATPNLEKLLIILLHDNN